MARYEEPFEDTTDLYNKYIEKAGIAQFINITVLTNNKAKDIYKVNKANELLRYRTGDDIIIVINEKVLDKLDEADKEMVIEESISSIHYNLEKDRIEISKPDVVTFSGVLSKHTFEKWDALRESIKTLYAAEKQAEDEAANAKTKGSKAKAY
jgi:hypothetical protein